MSEQYQIVRDVDGWRVIFAAGAVLEGEPRDTPQHRSEAAARAWAEEVLRLDAEGRRLLAERR